MDDGRSAGVVTLDQARYLATEHGLDLVLINSKTNPPIAKLLDYNKYRYQKEKQSRSSQRRTSQLKEIRLSFTIDKHDLEIKAKRAREFLEQGHLVRIFIILRGRQNVFPDKAKQILRDFLEMAQAEQEQEITAVGERIQLIMKPKKRQNAQN